MLEQKLLWLRAGPKEYEKIWKKSCILSIVFIYLFYFTINFHFDFEWIYMCSYKINCEKTY